jgi:DNA polymerase-3 subunit alpha
VYKIDIDISPDQRDLVYQYIIDRFGSENTSYILASGTVSDRGTIDEIVRALGLSLQEGDKIKTLYESNPEKTRKDYPNVFYYFDGLKDTVISQSMHPAGMLASSVNLVENYGTFWNKGFRISCINMEEVHEVSIPKYDILGLRNIQIIRETCELAGIEYPLSHKVNWNDEDVWSDIKTSPVGIFQFESHFAFDCMKKFKPVKVDDLSLVNACIRPSGTSYRDLILNHMVNENPSKQIDELLKNTFGRLVYQEDTIRFLQEVCGLSGSEADNVRRAIGRKQLDRLEKALPQILDGYCNKSDKPRDIAEEEAKQFLQIIEDSADYQFGFNHSTGYSMVGYLCAMLRCYYPIEFITAFMNCSTTEEDISNGMELARIKKIKIQGVKFRYSTDSYFIDRQNNTIYKGIGSVKFLNKKVANELYELGKNKYDRFSDLLFDIKNNTSCNSKQLDILIKLDFFSEFGEIQKLVMIVGITELFKFGEAKKFDIEKVDEGYIKNAIEKFSTNIGSNGKLLKRANILDCKAIIYDCEDKIKQMKVDSFTVSQRAHFQQEYLGYISLSSGKEEDRTKLYIKEVYPVRRKKDGVTFGQAIIGQSLGSAKETRYTIFNKDYIRCGEIKKGDVILCKHYNRNGQYFNIDNYEILFE